MATDTTKVWVPAPPKARGVIYRAPLGTVLPVGAAAPLDPVYLDLGGISDAGIVNAQAREVEKKRDFGGAVIATVQTDYTETLKVEFVESTKLEVLQSVFGGANVVLTAADAQNGTRIMVDHNADLLPKDVYIVDMIQGTGLRRLVAAIAKPTTVDDVTMVHTEIIKYAVTFETFQFVDNGRTFWVREYIDDGVPVAAAPVSPAPAPVPATLVAPDTAVKGK